MSVCILLWLLDSDGNPHISYYDETNGNLKYAYNDGSKWDIIAVDSTGDVGVYTSLALDDAGNPHISYYDKTNGYLKYAHYNGTAPDISAVDSVGQVQGYTSLALDNAGNPYIGYYCITQDLKCAYFNEEWQIETVDSEGNVGQMVSIALNSAGNPCLSYYDQTNGDLKYAYVGSIFILPESPIGSAAAIVASMFALACVVGYKKFKPNLHIREI
jgi:hypothetical protein